MNTLHYRVEKAYDNEFMGWLDVDRNDKAEIIARLHVRNLLPLDPASLYIVEYKKDAFQIRVRSSDCVALNLYSESLGSVQPEADEAQDKEDAAVDKYLANQLQQAEDALRHLLNELKAIEETDEVRDRRSVGRRMAWLSTYIDNGGKMPPVKKLIAEAHALPVQS